MEELTYNDVFQQLHYDPKTGYFVHRITGVKTKGYLQNTGYRVIKLNGRPYKVHRLVWLLHYKEWPKGTIDHIDGDEENNHISNLRDVPLKENLRNRSMRTNNKSGVVGVFWYPRSQRWVAKISIDGKNHHLGYFDNKEDAIAVRKKAEKDHGFHANHGRQKGSDGPTAA